MKRILPYLKFIVPIACFVSVAIVIFMAMKVNDLKDQKEYRETNYSAEEEFFGTNEIQENKIENNLIENNVVENNTTKKEEKVYGISTYDLNELDEESVSDESSKTAYSEEDEKTALEIIENVLGTEKYDITYKEFSEEGEYIFNVKNIETGKETLKAVDVVSEIISNYE